MTTVVSKWTYNGKDYGSAYAVRQAIFDATRKAFGAVPTNKDEAVTFWAGLGVTYSETETEYVPSTAELKSQAIMKRNQLLTESDFYVLPDYPSTEEGLVEVKAYRQALRDVPQQEGFPEVIIWADKPSVLGGGDAE